MIERGTWLLRSEPQLFVEAKSARNCGCACFIGIRLDNNEASVAVSSCGPEHQPTLVGLIEALRASAHVPTDRRLADVVDEMLNDERRWTHGHDEADRA